MTIKRWLYKAQRELQQADIATARLDALVLLQDSMHKDKSYLLAHPEIVLPASDVKRLQQQLIRRTSHEPLAYIRGKSEFYGRDFLVTPDTLEPRPETETMITLLRDLATGPQSIVSSFKTIVDVGAGSGCIAITAKLELPNTKIIATEINQTALKVAKKNAKHLNADITFFHGDLLEPLLLRTMDHGPWTIVANLPYVPDSHTINQAAMQEPKIAIFGGPDGLDLYRRMFTQISELTDKPGYVFTESLPFQHAELAKIVEQLGYTQEAEEDFIQLFKNVKFT